MKNLRTSSELVRLTTWLDGGEETEVVLAARAEALARHDEAFAAQIDELINAAAIGTIRDAANWTQAACGAYVYLAKLGVLQARLPELTPARLARRVEESSSEKIARRLDANGHNKVRRTRSADDLLGRRARSPSASKTTSAHRRSTDATR